MTYEMHGTDTNTHMMAMTVVDCRHDLLEEVAGLVLRHKQANTPATAGDHDARLVEHAQWLGINCVWHEDNLPRTCTL
jgi:hypothetical protein